MGTAYRSLVLKFDLSRLQPEVAEKIPKLLKVQEEFRRWTTEWVRSGGSLPLPEPPLKHFAKEFLYANSVLKWFIGLRKNGIEVRRMRPPLIFSAQLRMSKEKDVSMGVFVDVPKKTVKIRKWSRKRGETIVLPLGDSAIRWISARAREGGKLVLAAVWIGASRGNRAAKLYVALVFRREIAPMRPKRLLVIDFNALHNGLSWAVVEGERITKGVLRPDVSKITRLQKAAARLDALCAEKDETCDKATAVKSRVWRLLRNWEHETAKKLVQLALQYKAVIVVDVPEDSSIRTLKESGYAPEKKVLLNFGRLRRRLKGLAEWYGVPYREQRLYSTICPHCGGKMSVQPSRRVRCTCGFEAHRDEVPALWAAKRFSELTSFSSSSFSAAPTCILCGVLSSTVHTRRPAPKNTTPWCPTAAEELL